MTDIGVFQHKSIYSVDLSFTIPADARTWLVDDAGLEADVFEHLLEIKERTKIISTILNKFVTENAAGSSVEFDSSMMATAGDRSDFYSLHGGSGFPYGEDPIYG